jgi:hypothetical protein
VSVQRQAGTNFTKIPGIDFRTPGNFLSHLKLTAWKDMLFSLANLKKE